MLCVFSADFLLMRLQDFYDFLPTAKFGYEEKLYIFYFEIGMRITDIFKNPFRVLSFDTLF